MAARLTSQVTASRPPREFPVRRAHARDRADLVVQGDRDLFGVPDLETLPSGSSLSWFQAITP